MLENILLKRVAFTLIALGNYLGYLLTDDAFCVKAKRFNKMFTTILALFFLPRIASKSQIYAANFFHFHKHRH